MLQRYCQIIFGIMLGARHIFPVMIHARIIQDKYIYIYYTYIYTYNIYIYTSDPQHKKSNGGSMVNGL